ncbi:hypothetical protein NLU13_6169 [Sarocladium strictum]|uniref:Uncharacterized protein n=1 Tax=Sarocladium strictum TaxID=5046 RepID=A0AA39GFD9_SARSR|nr:hypothetical protein NLU13_6169 [Sarocladium strictum]
MCLPCFPWTWTKYEDPLDSMPDQSIWLHDGQSWALQKLPPVAPVPMGQYMMPQQMHANQHMLGHPTMAYAQNFPMAQQFQPMPLAAQPGGMMAPPGGGPPTVIPIMAGNPGPNASEVAGVGRTPMEEAVRQHQFAHANNLFEPQDFKPADDDPSRYYYVREVDGNWTQRNRFSIENTGDCRWFVTPEGWFYAVRQPD